MIPNKFPAASMRYGYPHNYDFWCRICAKEQTGPIPPILVTDVPVCRGCFERTVRPYFQSALQDDSQYPMMWEGCEIEVTQFRDVLALNELQAYIHKGKRLSKIPFKCAVCLEEDTSIHPSVDVVGNQVCRGCFDCGIMPLLKAAMSDETNYPPMWGKTRIEIHPFLEQQLVPVQFAREYYWKENEYDVLPKKRVYCAQRDCLGPFVREASAVIKESAKCHSCSGVTCLKCRRYTRRPLISRADFYHECEEFQHSKDDVSTFSKETRGQEWQLCPGCGAMSALVEACNHVHCSIHACGKSYCFVCGEPAKEGFEHWREGGCPRYGHPSDPDGGRFDRDDGEEDEEEAEFVELDEVELTVSDDEDEDHEDEEDDEEDEDGALDGLI